MSTITVMSAIGGFLVLFVVAITVLLVGLALIVAALVVVVVLVFVTAVAFVFTVALVLATAVVIAFLEGETAESSVDFLRLATADGVTGETGGGSVDRVGIGE